MTKPFSLSAFRPSAFALARAETSAPATPPLHNVKGRSDMTIKPSTIPSSDETFSVAQFVHAAGAIALMERSRGLNCAGKVKPAARRRGLELANLCRIFLHLEYGKKEGRGLPSSRSGSEFAILLKQVEGIVRLFPSEAGEHPVPGPHLMRRALRTYERSAKDAAALLNLISEIR